MRSAGQVVCWGDAGTDTFRFRGTEGDLTIRDFDLGREKIEIVDAADRFGQIEISHGPLVDGITFDDCDAIIRVMHDFGATLSASDFTFI